MPDPKLPLTGGCMCEQVRFEVSEPLLGALYCHCKRCQRRTGTGFSVTALVVPGSYRTVAGEDAIGSGIRPSVHQFTPFAAPWAPVPDDGLPRFPRRLGDGDPLPDS